MKIAFPVITAATGSDVYYRRLQTGLAEHRIRADIIPLTTADEFVPGRLGRVRAQLRHYDLIHTNADYGALLQVPGIPLVVTLHHDVFAPAFQRLTTLPQKLYHHGLLQRRIRSALDVCAAAVCPSRATRDSARATFGPRADRLQVIPNGIDTRRFSPGTAAPAPRQLLFVGTLSRRKGADLLRPIMAQLGSGYHLTCITTTAGTPFGTDHFQLVRQVALDDLPEWYRRCQLLLFPSHLEGFGYAVAEAMACGRPVVCSRAASLPELVDDEAGGLLCAPGDICAFAAAVARITADQRLATRMGAHNRSRAVAQFDQHVMLEQYVRLYRRLLGGTDG